MHHHKLTIQQAMKWMLHQSQTHDPIENIKKTTIKIKMQKFCEKINKIVFLLHKTEKNEMVESTADQISLDKNMLNAMPQLDAHLIGYTTAMENMLQEKVQLQQCKKKNQ